MGKTRQVKLIRRGGWVLWAEVPARPIPEHVVVPVAGGPDMTFIRVGKTKVYRESAA